MIDVERNEYDISEACSLKSKYGKRYCFKTPEGKFIYACAGSEADSYLEANSEKSEPNFHNEEYYNLQYLEENIDFPLERDADAVELYSVNKKIFTCLMLVITCINIS
eukprot:CAMPEP_0168355000 /NCGR_PEP_ID=MMETSP0213-20121227/24258_1 /TAXON_ID=151035 /ORGANISM="Euplotes harpa, Strain FSP1.4" /LENGTH=107 /DNA_ID=CAMNT_0008367063 /DNA_START=1 /DNA_END=324 /DNA_ORIENTATION=+